MTLKAKILRDRKINRRETQVTTQFYKQQKKLIARNNLDGLLEQIRERGEEAHDKFSIHLIRVLNGANWISFNDFDDLEDYYNGKVRDETKFLDFHQVQITCIYS